VSTFRLLYPAFAIVLGLLMLFRPLWFRNARRREYQRRLAARMERGSDAYFEELRGLKAYPTPRTGALWQLFGGFLVLAGAFILFETATGK
jgi:hypothetical protein